IRGVGDHAYHAEYERNRDRLHEAGRIAQAAAVKGLPTAFGELTGNRIPTTLAAGLGKAARVIFVPSMHLGSFMSYVLYPPNVIIFFSAEYVLSGAPLEAPKATDDAIELDVDPSADMVSSDLLEALRALGDA